MAIFEDSKFANIILDSLKWLRENRRMYLLAFAVMPNHVHFIFRPQNGYTAEKISQAFGSYTAHEILILSRRLGRQDMLNAFYEGGLGKDDRKNSIWEIL